MKKIILAGGTVFTGDDSFIGSVVIDGERIAEVLRGPLNRDLYPDTEYDITDCTGRMVLPGAIDEHVHFRDPGLTEKGDMATESRAAVAGGVTSFFDMPNTKPQTTTREAWEEKMRRAAEVSVANYAFFPGATNSNADELLAMNPCAIPGIKVFMGSSTGDMLVDRNATLSRLFREFRGVIAVHAESEEVIRRNRAMLQKVHGDEIPLAKHHILRSRRACFEATEKAVRLAMETGARLHVMHISTVDELRFFSPGPVTGKRITCETCPHYLVFTAESVEATGGLTKCNPAIKEEVDRQALLKALRDGLIDVVATDHAPHLRAQKRGNALTATSGMPSVQFSLPVMLQLAKEGNFSYETVVQRMCAAPAQLFGVEERGFLRPGYRADVAVVAPCAPYTVTDDMVVSRCGWTPYAGKQLEFSVEQTWVNGRCVWCHGEIVPDVHAARPITFNH